MTYENFGAQSISGDRNLAGSSAGTAHPRNNNQDEIPRILDAVRDQNGDEHVKFGRSDEAIWISYSDFAADERSVFARLGRIGVRCLTAQTKNAVKKELQNAPVSRAGLVAARPGWLTDGNYVFADGTICRGDKTDKEIIITFEPDERFVPRGSHREWKKKLGPIIKGQPLATFLLSYAFVGPLLRFAPPHLLNPMIELVGPPECGKTTYAVMAAAVHTGNPSSHVGGAETWNMTEAAFDPVRTVFNDCLLVVDEQNEQDVTLKLAGKMPFKQASTGSRRRFTEERKGSIRLALLSTSNEATGSSMKGPTHVVSAAKSRNCTISFSGPIMERPPVGFEDTRTAMEALRAVCDDLYGVAGRTFIAKLAVTASDDPEALRKRVRRLMNGFRSKVKVAPGVSNRIVDMFALTYAAGVMAKKWNLLPTGSKSVAKSVLEIMATALPVQKPDSEEEPSASAVAAIKMILRKKMGDIADMGSDARPKHPILIGKRFAYIRTCGDGLVRYFIPTASFRVACPSHKELLGQLKVAGKLIHEGGAKPKLSIKSPAFVPGTGRVYCVELK